MFSLDSSGQKKKMENISRFFRFFFPFYNFYSYPPHDRIEKNCLRKILAH